MNKVAPVSPYSDRSPQAHLGSKTPSLAILVALVFASGLGVSLGGCQPATTEQSAAAKSYDSRGIVRRLPADDQSMKLLQLQHEAIANFEGLDGEVSEMQSMTMPFPIHEDVDWSGLEVGDRVSFTFETQWEASPPFQITALQPLASDTRFDFEEEVVLSEDADADSEAADGELQ